MRSWVVYSVSAYLGLLLAGSIANPALEIPRMGGPMASVYEPTAAPRVEPTHLYTQPAIQARAVPSRADS